MVHKQGRSGDDGGDRIRKTEDVLSLQRHGDNEVSSIDNLGVADVGVEQAIFEVLLRGGVMGDAAGVIPIVFEMG
jgi:hypothetical protein